MRATRTKSLIAAIVALLACGSAVAAAAESATTTSLPAGPAKEQISVADAPSRVENVLARLGQIEAEATVAPHVAAIARRLPSVTQSIAVRVPRDQDALAATGDLGGVETILARWGDASARLRGWDETLGRRASDLEARLGELADLERLWERTRDALRDAAAPAELLGRVATALGTVGRVRGDVTARRDAVLTLRNQVAQQRALVDALEAEAEARRTQLLTAVFVRDQPPLWMLAREPPSTPMASRARGALETEIGDLMAFVSGGRAGGPLALGALIAIVLIALGLSRHTRAWGEQGTAREQGAVVLERPISAALVLWVILLPWLQVPMAVRHVASLLLILPLIRLLRPLLDRAAGPTAGYLVSLLLLDRIAGVFAPVPELTRPLFLLEMGVGYLAARWVRRLCETDVLTTSARARRAVRRVARAAQGLLVVAAIADVVGFVRLARLLGDGTVIAGCGALAVWILKRVLDGMVLVALRARPLGGLRVVQHNYERAVRGARQAIGWALLALWGWAVLRLFHVGDIVAQGLRSLLGTTVGVGQIAISLGDVLIFGLAVFLSFALSRVVRVVLEEEVLSRLVLPRGLPYAISTAAGYAVLLLGLAVAFAAAGIEVGRITIVLGALGVGVGFGLQEIVRDFVAGSVLLVERPIQLGDVVQMGDILGEVRRIGMRSSTIRTYEGAEMIVPNSSLTSSQIVNWTLSDRRRRIDLPVGVAYGTDPARVIALLEDTARRHPDVLAEPGPVVLFMGFGESSLDFQLRAWTDAIDRFMVVRSEIAVAINAALTEAGITIPFPQRDLHVRTLPPGPRTV